MKTYAALDKDGVVLALTDDQAVANFLVEHPSVVEIVAVGDAPCGLGWRYEGSVFSPPAK